MKTQINENTLKDLLIDNWEDVEIHTHPSNLQYLEKYKSEAKEDYVNFIQPIKMYPDPFGIKIFTSEALPRFIQVWQFPETKFTQYEIEDEVWAIPVGFGKYVDDINQPAFFKLTKPIYTQSVYWSSPFGVQSKKLIWTI